jgi:NTP pyrophosphatase (non-canonical NTP hydrolase)
MERYKKESLCVRGADERMRVSGFVNGTRPWQLYEELNKYPPRTMEEAMEKAEAFIRGKEAL